MDNVKEQTATDQATPGEVREQRWSALVVLPVAWILPATTARRLSHLSLKQAWLIHFAAVVLTTALILFLVAYYQAGLNGHEFLFEVSALLDPVIRELNRHPIETTLEVLATFMGIEVGFAALALLVMSWGAQDEPIRGSFRNAMRQTWLRSAHAIPVVLLVGMVAIGLSLAVSSWTTTHPAPEWPTYPASVTVSPNDPSFQEVTAEYEAAKAEYQRLAKSVRKELGAWQASRRWWVRYQHAFVVQACFASALWILWALLRAVGVSRVTTPIIRPPTCEKCGYNLTGAPPEGRCSECGEPVIDSLGPNSRPGAIWGRRAELGRWSAWTQTSLLAFRHPGLLGQRLRLSAPVSDHRSFVALHLPFIFLIGASSMPLVVIIDAGWKPVLDNPEVILIAGPIAGSLSVFGALGLMMLASCISGSAYFATEKRNLMSGSMQVAAYLSPYLVGWLLFGVCSAITMTLSDKKGYFQVLEDISRIDSESLAFMAWFVPNLVWFIWYFVLVGRGTQGTRYANT